MTTMDEETKTKFPLVPGIINGGVGGIIGVSCTFPLDLVKTRLQNQQASTDIKRAYRNMMDCLQKTYRTEGFRGLYRGMTVAIVSVTPEKAINLASNDYFRHHLKEQKSTDTLSWPQQMLAGGMAGLLQTVVVTPMELLKIQMQNAGYVNERVTAISTAIQVVREKGIVGLYKGIGPTGLRDVCFSLVYFPVFAELNLLGPRKQDSNDAVFWYNFLSGMTAGSLAALAVTPIDVVKTRLQTLHKPADEQEFDGMLDCFQKTLRSEGPRAFLKGGLCRVMVIAPLFGIAQTVYLMGVAQKLLAMVNDDE